MSEGPASGLRLLDALAPEGALSAFRLLAAAAAEAAGTVSERRACGAESR